jgi:hypothetical protein
VAGLVIDAGIVFPYTPERLGGYIGSGRRSPTNNKAIRGGGAIDNHEGYFFIADGGPLPPEAPRSGRKAIRLFKA